MPRKPPPVSRNPSPELVLFIARAAKELGEKASSRCIKAEYLASDRFQMLIWAWRLRRALDPFWRPVPFYKDPNFKLVGWSSQVLRGLTAIYSEYERAHKHFIAYCDDYPEHPLMTTCFRLVIRPAGAGAATRPLLTPATPENSEWLDVDQRYFTRDHVPNWVHLRKT